MLARRFAAAAARAAPRAASAAPRRALAAGVSAKMVKELRTATGAPMIECKQALQAVIEEHGEADTDKALEWLRKKGTAVAQKKAGRAAAQGLVGTAVAVDAQGGSWGAVVEVNSETDFVARNESFLELVDQVARAAVAHAQARGSAGPVAADELAQASTPAGPTVADALTDAVTAIRENLVVRRAEVAHVPAGEGLLAPYVHGAVAPTSADGVQAGRIGTIVSLRGASEGEADLGRRLAMHVAAASPRYLARDGVPAEVLDHERGILREQALKEGKPEHVVDKMIVGRLNKFYEEQCLLDQAFLVSGEEKPPKVGKALPKGVTVESFVKFVCGEEAEAPAEAQQ